MKPQTNGHDRPVGPNGGTPGKVAASLIENVEVKVETFLSETKMSIAELRALKPGSVITLGAQLNEFVELRVNGVRIGHGELVAIGERFGVRIVVVGP